MKEFNQEIKDYTHYIKAPLSETDPEVNLLVELEKERQVEKLILIPSESICPEPVREALASPFTNLYAEGYPPLRMCQENDREVLLDVDHQLAHYRRYADRRFYKGVEFADFIESLAQRRIARCFATPNTAPDKIFVNVQPLSGAAANNSVYAAFLKPGDTIMGMHLSHGGHLTHGSEFNRSGKYYRVISYEADPKTGRLNYDRIRQLALRHKPKIIIAGYSAYPWSVDWGKFREIASCAGAILLADIAHVAGMVVAGVYPSPVGYADVITFTTHKTLCGPRGAAILTTDRQKAELIDNAVFPGEQGGPHVNKMAGIATTFRIANTEEFQKLQEKILKNAKALARFLAEKGLNIAYGGTDTHLLLIDLNTINTNTGYPLKGEIAARILDLCGIVVNKNTIPGDEDASVASGIRLGTPWITQRGYDEKDMEKIAQLVHKVLVSIHPFTYTGMTGDLPRGKIPLSTLQEVKQEVRNLTEKKEAKDKSQRTSTNGEPKILKIKGQRAKPFLQEVGTANIAQLKVGDMVPSFLLGKEGEILDTVIICRLASDNKGRDCYLLATTQSEKIKTWIQGLSDAYILFDTQDIFAKIQGPVVIQEAREDKKDAVRKIKQNLRTSVDKVKKEIGQSSTTDTLFLYEKFPSFFDLSKPYFIGQRVLINSGAVPEVKKQKFSCRGRKQKEVKKSFLYEEHQRLGAKFTRFAGWEMPIYYTSIGQEHRAVRTAAGLFDVSHMGLIQVSGEGAPDFLDVVFTNYIRWIKPGQSQYGYILDPEGRTIDDVMVYYREKGKYMMVCNAANQEKVLSWLQAVASRKYIIDKNYPAREVKDAVDIKNLKHPRAKDEQKIDIALQGPGAADILSKLVESDILGKSIKRLRKNEFIEGRLAGKDTIISRTGYTGEQIGYEVYVHPQHASFMWNLILNRGKHLNLRPCGLGARNSTRVEAGLPLYGHELAGKYQIDPTEAGYGPFVKFHKPFFVGRDILLETEKNRTRKKKIIRFKLKHPSGRVVREEDPVVDRTGKYMGRVTSCVLAEEYQIGLAYVDCRIQRGENIAIFPLPRGRFQEKPAGNLSEGDRTVLPQEAVVLARFLEQEELI